MQIKIEKKITPFSSQCGTRTMILCTTYEVRVFPVKLEFYNKEKLAKEPDLEMFFDIKGPMKKFVVFQDVERSYIEVSFFSKEGFIKYKIKNVDEKIAILLEKSPKVKLDLKIVGEIKHRFIERKKWFFLPLKTRFIESRPLEFLSLGVHKAQDIENIKKRASLNEIFPIWFALGQRTFQITSEEVGSAALFARCQTLISEKKKEILESVFLNIYNAGFSSLFAPSLLDEYHQGIIDEGEKIPHDSSPLILLQRGYEIIRSLFILQEKNTISLLPCLFPIFHSGRMVNLKVANIGRLDIEWSKKLLKKVILYSEESTEIRFALQKAIKSFRMRKDPSERGRSLNLTDSVKIEKNKNYYFDRFEK